MTTIALDLVSDTHCKHNVLSFTKPEADVHILCHSGDFSHFGKVHEVTNFANWCTSQDHDYKVVIAGNHEMLMDTVKFKDPVFLWELAKNKLPGSPTPSNILTDRGIHYLEETSVTIEGLKFFGTPYSSRFFDWGFQADPGADAVARWAKMPDDTDVCLVHGPPFQYGDKCPDMNNRSKIISVGDKSLLAALRKVKPMLTLFGHIHEGHGQYNDVVTGCTYINASVLNGRYEPHGYYHRVFVSNKKIMKIEEIYY